MYLSLKNFFFVCIILMVACSEDQNQKTHSIPVRDFFRNPDKTNFLLSPDGQFVSYLQSYKNRLNLFVENISTKQVTQITAESDRNIEAYFWANNEQLLFLKDKNGDEYFHLYSVSKNGSNLRDLTPFEKVKLQIIDEMEDKDDEIIIGLNKRNPEIFDAYRLFINTGKLELIAENPGNFSRWMTDHEGKLRLAIATDGVNQSMMYRDSEDQPFRKIVTTDFRENIVPCCFTPDNKFIYAGSNLGRDKMAIVVFDPAIGKEVKTVYANQDVDVSQIYYSNITKKPIMCGFNTWKYQLEFLDDSVKKIFTNIENQLKGYEVVLSDMDKKEARYLIRTYSDKSLGAYYLYDKTSAQLSKLSDISPWLKESELADMKPITFQTRDSITINGYLVLPPGVDAQNLPVIVNPHGGPWWRNRWGFSAETQFFASRGYAVFQINYRGSRGYGREFWTSGFKQMGRKMQDDISDGVEWLIREKIANPKRIAIYGYNFGGFHALSGITFTPSLYRCAISYSGVSNLFNYIKDIPPYQKPFLEMNYEMVGNPEKDAEYFRSVSPVFHTGNIKAPVMIVQGASDPRLSVTETNQFVKDLKKKGVNVTFILKENEGHEFKNEENKIELYTEMEKFLSKNLK